MKILKKYTNGRAMISVQGIPQNHKLVACGKIDPENYFVITANKDNSQFFNNCNVRIGRSEEIMTHVPTHGMEREHGDKGYFKVMTERGIFSFKLPDPTKLNKSKLDDQNIVCIKFQLPN